MNTTTVKEGVVVGVFENRADAQSAVEDLRDNGFRHDQIGLAARDNERATVETDDNTGTRVAEVAGAGVALGAGAGALWTLGVAAGMLPAIGPVVAGGLLAAVAASAAAGGAAVGLAGALIGLGIPDDEAAEYDEEFKAGRTIVTVRPEGRYDTAVDIMDRHHGFELRGEPVMPVDSRPGF